MNQNLSEIILILLLAKTSKCSYWSLHNVRVNIFVCHPLFVCSDRSSYSDDVLLYICGGSSSSRNFFRFPLSPLMQLMLQVSLQDALTVSMQLMSQDAD